MNQPDALFPDVVYLDPSRMRSVSSDRFGRRNASVKTATDAPGPWEAWKTRSLHARAIRFMQTYCITSKGYRHGKPIKLAEFQKNWLEDVLVEGVSASALTLPRGNGKSTFTGALATWATFDTRVAAKFGGKPDVPVIAPSLKQARKGVYGAACDFRRNHPDLFARSVQYTATGEERIYVPATHAELYPAAAEVDTLQGLDPLLAIIDEIGFISVEAWEALMTAEGKRPRNLILALGTRNPGDVPNALDHLLATIEAAGGIDGFVLVDYHADIGCDYADREQWRKANPALVEGFLRESAIASAMDQKLPGFPTFRLNIKSGNLLGWLGPEGPAHWDACGTSAVVFDDELPMWLGVDKSASGDCSAVTALQLVDGQWLTTAKVFFPNPTIDHAAVRDHLRHMCHTYNVAAIGYDERYFVEGAQELADEGLPMIMVPQTPARLVAPYSWLREDIIAHRLVHDGDPTYRSHVLGAVPKIDISGGFTLAKRPSRTKIDAAVALGIARAVCPIKPVAVIDYSKVTF